MTAAWIHRVLLGAIAAALLPIDDAPATDPRCAPEVALRACDGGDRYECEWGRLLAGRGSLASLARVVEGDPADLDELLRILFTAIGDKPIADQPVVLPAGLAFELEGFDPYPIPVPVDWRADPYGNGTWRFHFQSLHRLYALYKSPDDAALDAGAALVIDWVEHAMYEVPALDQSWGDHAIPVRVDRVSQLVERYIARRPVLDRRFLHAAAQLVVSHVYALAAECCYQERHNHGTMQDLAILELVKRYPALRDGDRIFELAGRRLVDRQLRHSVTEDGVHVENSPCYHLLYVELLDSAIRAFRSAGAAPPAELVALHDSMLEPLAQLLQPDRSFPQFGDCTDEDHTADVARLLDTSRAPELGDRVFELGGYAIFRDRGDGAVVHLKAGHLSPVHYHADETSFELFAHGRELIVGPGLYSHDDDDPYWHYQRSPAAQNALVVDGDATVPEQASRASGIVGHGVDAGVPWVQASHARYRRLGVSSLVRTLGFAKPDTVVVVDHVRASDGHDLDQHFHLSPEVTELRRVGDRTVVALIEGGASLTITAAVPPVTITTPRGVDDGVHLEGWYFPDFRVKVPAHDVVLRHHGGEVDLPVVIVVTAPGAPPRIPTDLAYVERDGEATVTWSLDGVAHRLRVPAR